MKKHGIFSTETMKSLNALPIEQQILILDDLETALTNRIKAFKRINNSHAEQNHQRSMMLANVKPHR